ncbi:unnamed protein product [Allacma fusca]|uniref:Uncharacterized protein n=1 Tax=Allacma fusca TaxID=39272 RepID=A0A8J2JWG3_9HEXA|nr:unnamed protein product [Allacma fusca]
MKFLVLVAFIGLAAAAPRPDAPEVTIVRSSHDINDDGSFSWVSETSDGTLVSQSGRIKNPEEPDQEKRILLLEGEFKYVADNGDNINLKYTADENGFQPIGEHLPTAPPTPDHVLKTLEILNANAAAQTARG